MSRQDKDPIHKLQVRVRVETRAAILELAERERKSPTVLVREWIESDLRRPLSVSDPSSPAADKSNFILELDESDYLYLTRFSKATSSTLSESVRKMVDSFLFLDDPIAWVQEHLPFSEDRRERWRYVGSESRRKVVGHLPLPQVRELDRISNEGLFIYRSTLLRAAVMMYKALALPRFDGHLT